MAKNFQQIISELVQEGVDLGEFKNFLGETQSPHEKTLVFAPEATPSPQKKLFNSIKHAGIWLLAKKKLDVADLNQSLQELDTKNFSTQTFLQILLKKRKISVEDFLELEAKSPDKTKQSLPKLPYEVEFNETDLRFSLLQSEYQKIYGHYHVLEELARGGMGIVYKAYHPGLNQTFALKVLMDGRDASEDALKRFHREIQSTAKLKHPNIIQVVDSGQKDKEHYFVMEFIEGETLTEWLQGKHSLRERAILIQKCLHALHYAHKQGVIHRDIKPDNILLTKEGEPKITDFGLAKDHTLDESSQKLTKTGMVFGTPAYMPPEQVNGEMDTLDHRADCYSMGVCLYEALTHKRPFLAATEFQLFDKIFQEDPFPPSSLNSEIHQDLDTIVLKSMEKLPEARYQSAKSFADDLERFLSGFPIKARPASTGEKVLKWIKRNRQIFLFGVILCFLLVTFLSYLVWEKGQKKKNLRLTQEKEFKIIYHQALEEQQKAEKLGSEFSDQKIPFLLKALQQLNHALRFNLFSLKIEKQKLKIGKSLIELACESKNYQLADYIVSDLQSLSILDTNGKDKLKEKLLLEKNKSLKQHQQRLQYWINTLKKQKINAETREALLFEISKMPEKEIFEQLVQIFEEGVDYFLKESNSNVQLNSYYEIMVVALGWLENPAAGKPLLKSLKRMSKQQKALTIAQMNFMIAITKGLACSKFKGAAKTVKEIRWKLGQHGSFWVSTNSSYKILLERDKLEEEKTDNADSYLERAKVKNDQNDFKGAIQDYTIAIALNPQLHAAFVGRGIARSKSGDFKGAIEDHTQAIELAPLVSGNYSNRATARSQTNDFKGALQDYNKALNLNPKSGVVYLLRGNIKVQTQNFQEAIKDYSKALECNPQLFLAIYSRGNAKFYLRDFEGAIEDYTMMSQLQPTHSQTFLSRGMARVQKREPRKALEDFNTAIRLEPDLEAAYHHRGALKSSMKDHSGSIEDYNEAIRLNPKNIRIFYNRAVSKVEVKDFNGALKDFNLVLRKQPKFYFAYLGRGKLNEKMGNRTKAKEDFKKFLLAIRNLKDPRFLTIKQEIFSQFPELNK